MGLHMKKLLLILFIPVLMYGQYSVSSPYLQDASKAIGYVDSCASFWFNSYDQQYGGFYTNVGKTGNPLSTDKNLLTQSRHAYGFVRAYMMTGKEEFLDKARAALEFMFEHGWDTQNGGWYNELDKYGNPRNPQNNKSAFIQHYAMLGIIAYWEATRDTNYYNWITKSYEKIEQNLWDNRESYFGYYDAAGYNWNNPYDKSFNATVDAVTTHLLSLYYLTGEAKYKERLLQIAENMDKHLVASMEEQAIGFAEAYDSNWGIKQNNTMTIMGHVLKTAWCFGRIYNIEKNPKYLEAADKLVEDVLQKGYDHELGGPFKDYNRVTGQMLMWGNPDTANAWWQMEQAVTAGLVLHSITKDVKYLRMADESLDFFMKYFVDHTYGEVYENRTRYGNQTWGENKGGGGKAGYHSTELGYYTYLYGGLLLSHDMVSLYYNFSKDDKDRTIKLTPFSFPNNSVILAEVRKEGVVYPDFNPDNLTLSLHAGEGENLKLYINIPNHPMFMSRNNYELSLILLRTIPIRLIRLQL